MGTEITIGELCAIALRSGLKLAEEELQKLLPGVIRCHDQVAELRQLLSEILEPAATFSASQKEKR